MRGEWIEMKQPATATGERRLSPCGESGLKYFCGLPDSFCGYRLSPCGESGLKSAAAKPTTDGTPSLPMRGEWIEIPQQL